MNCGAISYGDVLLLVDKIRQQITRSPGLGNGPFSYEALDVIADALFKATQLHGPSLPELPTTEMINALAPEIKNWYGRPADYERVAKAYASMVKASSFATGTPQGESNGKD